MNEHEEAIKYLTPIAESASDKMSYGAMLKIAIEALEKQIPKKPLGISVTHQGRVGNCPCCGKFIIQAEHHCECGQNLDWSDEREIKQSGGKTSKDKSKYCDGNCSLCEYFAYTGKCALHTGE